MSNPSLKLTPYTLKPGEKLVVVVNGGERVWILNGTRGVVNSNTLAMSGAGSEVHFYFGPIHVGSMPTHQRKSPGRPITVSVFFPASVENAG